MNSMRKIPTLLGCCLATISALAACYDFTIYTKYSPTPVGACQGASPGAQCSFMLFTPSIKSCGSGPTRTNATCKHTSTEDVLWDRWTGVCVQAQGLLFCGEPGAWEGDHWMYNLEFHEAVYDDDCWGS
jgi:hypothetical protein